MNSFGWITGLALSAGMAMAQDQDPELPQTPTSFETRNSGGTAESEAAVETQEAKATKVTFTAVTESREWTDTSGKMIRGRLLAFEAAEGQIAKLVRDGKIRLLVDGAKRFSLLPLEKLRKEDRTHIEGLAAARKQQAGRQDAAAEKKP